MNIQDIEKIFDFFSLASKLKTIRRYSTSETVINKDSSADHSWKLALMTFVITEELNLNLKKYRVVKMALIHDLVETIAGDVDARLIYNGQISREQKQLNERRAINEIKEILPEKIGAEIYDLWNEYEEGETEEAKFVNILDKMEPQIKMIEDGYETWDFPDFIATYTDNDIINSPNLHEIHKIMKRKIQDEFTRGGLKWKDEYDINYL